MRLLSLLILLILLSSCNSSDTLPSPSLTPPYLAVSPPSPQSPVTSPLSPAPLSSVTSFPDPQSPVSSPFPSLSPAPSQSPITIHLSPTPLSPSYPSPAFQITYSPWDPVLAQAWSPDGSVLAVAAGSKVYLYDSKSFVLLRSIQLDAWVGGMEFYPDSSTEQLILSLILKNGKLEFWDASSSELICSIQAHPRSGNSLDYVPGGTVLATAGSDPMVRLWEMQHLIEGNSCSLEPAAELIGSSFAVPYLQFNPSGVDLASVDGRAVRIREVATERLAGVLQGEDSIFSIDYHPSGNVIAVAEVGEKVRLWDMLVQKEIGVLTIPNPQPGHFIWQVVFSPDGLQIAGGSSSGNLYLWESGDARKWEEPLTIEAGTRDICSISFNSDGSLLFSGSLDGLFAAWSISK